ncbi:carbohydrate porin [Klebsiella pneumoniae]|nr:carbohydrate porin [Klebsiella pneumoniae]QHU72312.1 carbohydrate porin [Klebsiella pneumoniae]
MRISVISAAVCCALFPLISVSAAGLSVEQRLAQLEARLNLAEQQASEASRRAQRRRSSRCRRSASRPRLANKNSRPLISN